MHRVWKTVDVPEEITAFLLQCNQKHFGQAAGTPFTVSPLNVEVDFTSNTESCKMMLTGDYDSSTLDDLTQLVIQHFAAITTLDVLP